MKLEAGKISLSQLMLLMIGFIIGSSLILLPGRKAQHLGWLAIIAGLIEGLLFVLIYTTLAKKFQGKTIIQINDLIYGPYLGKGISIAYLWYFFHLATLVLRNFGDFFTALILPETPMVVIIVLIALVGASAVRNGIEVICRCTPILTTIMFLSVIISVLLLLKDMEFKNLLPLFDIPIKDFIKASHSTATFPFGETVVFLMIFAVLDKPDKIRTYTMLALIIAGILLAVASIRDITILGVTESIHFYPSFQAVRLINIGGILTRLEIIVVGNLLAMGFLKVCVLYYGTVLGIAQILKLRSYLPLVLPIGALMVSYSILQFENMMENNFFAFDIYPYYALPFQVGIPLISLVIALIRGLPNIESEGE